MSDDRTPRPSDYVCAECGRAVPENAPCPHCSSPTPESMERATEGFATFVCQHYSEFGLPSALICTNCVRTYVARLLDELAEAKGENALLLCATEKGRQARLARHEIGELQDKLTAETRRADEAQSELNDAREIVAKDTADLLMLRKRIAALEAERDKYHQLAEEWKERWENAAPGPLMQERDRLLAAVESVLEQLDDQCETDGKPCWKDVCAVALRKDAGLDPDEPTS